MGDRKDEPPAPETRYKSAKVDEGQEGPRPFNLLEKLEQSSFPVLRLTLSFVSMRDALAFLRTKAEYKDVMDRYIGGLFMLEFPGNVPPALQTGEWKHHHPLEQPRLTQNLVTELHEPRQWIRGVRLIDLPQSVASLQVGNAISKYPRLQVFEVLNSPDLLEDRARGFWERLPWAKLSTIRFINEHGFFRMLEADLAPEMLPLIPFHIESKVELKNVQRIRLDVTTPLRRNELLSADALLARMPNSSAQLLEFRLYGWWIWSTDTLIMLSTCTKLQHVVLARDTHGEQAEEWEDVAKPAPRIAPALERMLLACPDLHTIGFEWPYDSDRPRNERLSVWLEMTRSPKKLTVSGGHLQIDDVLMLKTPCSFVRWEEYFTGHAVHQTVPDIWARQIRLFSRGFPASVRSILIWGLESRITPQLLHGMLSTLPSHIDTCLVYSSRHDVIPRNSGVSAWGVHLDTKTLSVDSERLLADTERLLIPILDSLREHKGKLDKLEIVMPEQDEESNREFRWHVPFLRALKMSPITEFELSEYDVQLPVPIAFRFVLHEDWIDLLSTKLTTLDTRSAVHALWTIRESDLELFHRHLGVSNPNCTLRNLGVFVASVTDAAELLETVHGLETIVVICRALDEKRAAPQLVQTGRISADLLKQVGLQNPNLRELFLEVDDGSLFSLGTPNSYPIALANLTKLELALQDTIVLYEELDSIAQGCPRLDTATFRISKLPRHNRPYVGVVPWKPEFADAKRPWPIRAAWTLLLGKAKRDITRSNDDLAQRLFLLPQSPEPMLVVPAQTSFGDKAQRNLKRRERAPTFQTEEEANAYVDQVFVEQQNLVQHWANLHIDVKWNVVNHIGFKQVGFEYVYNSSAKVHEFYLAPTDVSKSAKLHDEFLELVPPLERFHVFFAPRQQPVGSS